MNFLHDGSKAGKCERLVGTATLPLPLEEGVRAGELLDVSADRRTRPRQVSPDGAPDPRACAEVIAACADRGSTPDERAAAEAWLTTDAAPVPVDCGKSIGIG